MRITRRTRAEIDNGSALTQWLSGCAGAILTTLPAFIVLPAWFAFTSRFKVVDDEGKDDDGVCFFICFCMGCAVWGAALLIAMLDTTA